MGKFLLFALICLQIISFSVATTDAGIKETTDATGVSVDPGTEETSSKSTPVEPEDTADTTSSKSTKVEPDTEETSSKSTTVETEDSGDSIKPTTSNNNQDDRLLNQYRLEISLLHLALAKQETIYNESIKEETDHQESTKQSNEKLKQLDQQNAELQKKINQLQTAAQDDTKCQQQVKDLTIEIANLKNQLNNISNNNNNINNTIIIDEDEDDKNSTNTRFNLLNNITGANKFTIFLIISLLLGIPIIGILCVYCIGQRKNTNDEIKDRYSNDSANNYIQQSANTAEQSEQQRTAQQQPSIKKVDQHAISSNDNANITPTTLENGNLTGYFRPTNASEQTEYKAPAYTEQEQD